MGVELYASIAIFLRVLVTINILIFSILVPFWGITIGIGCCFLLPVSIYYIPHRILYFSCHFYIIFYVVFFCRDKSNISIIETSLYLFLFSLYLICCPYLHYLFYNCGILLFWFTICCLVLFLIMFTGVYCLFI